MRSLQPGIYFAMLARAGRNASPCVPRAACTVRLKGVTLDRAPTLLSLDLPPGSGIFWGGWNKLYSLGGTEPTAIVIVSEGACPSRRIPTVCPKTIKFRGSLTMNSEQALD